ncbi:MAG: universal stress protein [Deltaproteobacteria bacterium]|nr:universal stress protein [Deltaproteobacteria bacterium]
MTGQLVILCGLAFEHADTHVLGNALLLAKDLGARLRGIHAMDLGARPDAEALAQSEAARSMVQKMDERIAQAKAELDGIQTRYATFGVPMELGIVEGRPYEALAATSKAMTSAGEAVVLVVGSGRMQGTLLERILGSTTDQLLRQTDCPVLVVPHAAHDASHAGGVTKSLREGTWLVAIDGSDPSARALALAASWAEPMQARLAAVHASSDVKAPQAMREFLVAQPSPLVRALADAVHVVEDVPDAAISNEATATNAALVVLGSHGRTGIARAFLGSVAADVIRKATVPVLCVR